MRGLLTRLWRSRDAGPAAEFTLVLPILTLFILGMVDVGRLLWTWNQAEKATQMGARWAVATDFVVPTIASQNFVGVGGLTQGDVIPVTAYGTTTCTSTSTAPPATVTCACVGTCPWTATPAATGPVFDQIVRRMSTIMQPGQIKPSNVVVAYAPSGLGFAGDPGVSDVAPLVTVTLQNMTFTPLIFQLFNAAIPLPTFKSSLTLEDGTGGYAN